MPLDLTDQNLADPCADLQAQIAAYALGEVDADPQLLDHLAACPSCQEDLRAYVQVTHMLVQTAPDVAPPARLRERILASVEDAHESAQPAALVIASQPVAVQPPAVPRPRLLALFRPALALGFAVLVALLGWNVALQNRVSAQSGVIASQRESWQTMIALLNDPAVQWYSVAGGATQGHFWANPKSTVACFVAQGLPQLAEGQVYQVWLMRSGVRTSGGVFDENNGAGWILIRSDEPVASYDAVGISVEPRGGSSAPTTPLLLQGDLKAPHTPSSYERLETVSGLMSVAVQGE